MKSNNNGCHQSGCGCRRCSNEKFNCTGVRPFRAIDAACIPPIPEPPKEAYGSFYNLSSLGAIITPVTPPDLGQKINFSTPGPSLNVNPAPIPNSTTDLQVATGGVYEINMNILVELSDSTSTASATSVRLGLFINDEFFVPGSEFGTFIEIANGAVVPAISSFMGNTIGNTVLLRLNKDDRLSIRVLSASGNIDYTKPSLVVIKIAD
ncbi:hypothetical protein ACIQZG_15140 [Lysinibacillus sp. NPDC096418]|uniref:hypothetical protein n=1 Tax=Lysinibacillus sp. NPDC096418 TaxID=3364138 RepID=UPI003827D379